MTALLTLAAAAGGLVVPSAVRGDGVPVTLRGSSAAMARQHSVAKDEGYTFARTSGHMMMLEAMGELVRLEGSDDYGFRAGVSSLLGRPEMRTFLERVSADYRAACGEQLIVTSLTRPLNRQPRNAHRLSVHPAGIAVDLRVSRSAACRRWLEAELLAMEERGLLDVTREHSPPHYHVALFPVPYMEHVAVLEAAEAARRPPEFPPSPGIRASLYAESEAGLGALRPFGMVRPTAATGSGVVWRLMTVLPLALLAAIVMGVGRGLDRGLGVGGWTVRSRLRRD